MARRRNAPGESRGASDSCKVKEVAPMLIAAAVVSTSFCSVMLKTTDLNSHLFSVYWFNWNSIVNTFFKIII